MMTKDELIEYLWDKVQELERNAFEEIKAIEHLIRKVNSLELELAKLTFKPPTLDEFRERMLNQKLPKIKNVNPKSVFEETD